MLKMLLQNDSYFKIKFNSPLSDYKREMVTKFYFYVRGFVVSFDIFFKDWNRFKLPTPCNCTLQQAYQGLSSSFKLCIQDDRKKIEINLIDEKNTYVSIVMNFALKALDDGQTVFFKLQDPSCGEMAEFIQKQSEGLIALNTWLFSFQLHFRDEDLTMDEVKYFYPHHDYWGYSRSIKNIIDTHHVLYSEGFAKFDRVKQCALYSLVLEHNMMVAFCQLCALFLDATCSSLYHAESFYHMWIYLQYRYHNSHLYRIEIPLSPLITKKRTDQRGSKDHTTQMKIYLFDNNMRPILIRMDLPHANCNFLHANISTIHGEKVSGEDHISFDAKCKSEDLDSLFSSLHESIKEQTPSLFKIVDTTNKDEKLVFSTMQKYIQYNTLCMNILNNKPYDVELKKISGFLSKDKDATLEDILLNAYTVFK